MRSSCTHNKGLFNKIHCLNLLSNFTLLIWIGDDWINMQRKAVNPTLKKTWDYKMSIFYQLVEKLISSSFDFNLVHMNWGARIMYKLLVFPQLSCILFLQVIFSFSSIFFWIRQTRLITYAFVIISRISRTLSIPIIRIFNSQITLNFLPEKSMRCKFAPTPKKKKR